MLGNTKQAAAVYLVRKHEVGYKYSHLIELSERKKVFPKMSNVSFCLSVSSLVPLQHRAI